MENTNKQGINVTSSKNRAWLAGLLRTASVLLSALLILGAWECGPPPLTTDHGFDIWCGKQLCAWSVDRGSIKRAPTWHRSDFGVELVGDPVVLSQHLKVSDARCLQFHLQADRDDGVTLQLEMDFLDDGTSEYSHALTSDDYAPVSYKVTPPTWYEGVRVIVRKMGQGRAVVANLRIARGEDCKAAPLPLDHRPLGAPCGSALDCDSSHCVQTKQWEQYSSPPRVTEASVCSACTSDADCSSGMACGVFGGARYKVYRSCVLKGSLVLGERCHGASECASGVCCKSTCSQCCDGKGCAAGASCAKREEWRELLSVQMLPWQCAPGKGLGAAKAPCLKHSDCASGSCQGVKQLSVCFLDGRRCYKDADCPAWPSCWKVGTDGGSCQ